MLTIIGPNFETGTTQGIKTAIEIALDFLKYGLRYAIVYDENGKVLIVFRGCK